jgi:hypothetical protein
LIALDMPRLTLPVADETSRRLSDVVVFMRCVPLLTMIRNVALAMVTEVFTPVENHDGDATLQCHPTREWRQRASDH